MHSCTFVHTKENVWLALLLKWRPHVFLTEEDVRYAAGNPYMERYSIINTCRNKCKVNCKPSSEHTCSLINTEWWFNMVVKLLTRASSRCLYLCFYQTVILHSGSASSHITRSVCELRYPSALLSYRQKNPQTLLAFPPWWWFLSAKNTCFYNWINFVLFIWHSLSFVIPSPDSKQTRHWLIDSSHSSL